MTIVKSIIIILILMFIAASFTVGYKLGKTRTTERVITIFTNIQSVYTNIDYSVSNSGDPFLDFYVQLTNH